MVLNKSLAPLDRETGTKQGSYMQINIFVHRYLQTDDFWSPVSQTKTIWISLKKKKKA